MFLARQKLPVTAEQRAWIDDSMRLLITLFGRERMAQAAVVLPDTNFFPREYQPTQEWAAYTFDQVCLLMNVDRERVELDFIPDPWIKLRGTGFGLGPTSGAPGLTKNFQWQNSSLATVRLERQSPTGKSVP